ncbi:hypothetical protein [Alcanivorax sp. 1008]|uniref:hypothetical protein n=1 Tax=Alcanivorax sp. 1008 TaxID=2816853 RepID=UPI001DF61364|nr:hypothetical protein [Alcanivorax sp. 1008]MCC1495847.1 hypothetical protein [Alcanivorax sp. 1008]
MRTFFLPALLLTASFNVFAHSIPSEIGQPQLDVSLAVTARTDGAVASDEYWRIPGVMMGGHAWPAQRGISMDELSLSLGYRIDENFFAVLKAAQHSGHDDGPSIEHAWVGYVCCDSVGPLVIEAGRMSAAFTPSVSEHSSARIFSDATLPADAFLGRHFHDNGFRLWRHNPHGISFGVELWQGEAFPASADDSGGAADLFASLNHQSGRLTLQTGVWTLFARATERPDHRYSDGHTHGGIGAVPPPDVRFTGDSVLGGIHALIGWQVRSDMRAALRMEWMQVEADGVIEDITRRAAIDSVYSGIIVQPEITVARHSFALRAEQLVLDNHVTGAAALPLSEDANLINDHNPWRLGLGWRWQWRDALALRADLTRDATLGSAENRAAIGLVWHQSLTRQGAHQHSP